MQATHYIDDVRPLAHAVAAALGGWEVETRPGTPRIAWLVRGDVRFALTSSVAYSERGRIKVVGDYPRHQGRPETAKGWGVVPYDGREPSIMVSPNRSPEAIAEDIKRRFLPVFEPIAILCIKKASLRGDAEVKRYANLSRVSRVLGLRVSDQSRDPSARGYVGSAGDDVDRVHAEVRPDYDATISMRLEYLPADLAEEIAQLIANHAAAGSAKEAA